MNARALLPALVMVAVVAGCQKGPPQMPPPKPPEVVVARVTEGMVTDFEEFTGRTESVEVVEVRPRVGGQLESVNFKEGADVKQGEPLAKIDPKPLRAELERAEANLGQAEARVTRLESDFKRIQDLPKGTASGQEFDKIAGDLAEARKAVKSAEATRNIAKLNFDYTDVVAPISGRISRRMIERGNMVKADETALTVIVSLDPIYVSFDVDERTYRQVQHFLAQTGVGTEQRRKLPVFMGLADENGYPRAGTINFVDNRVDPNTGSVWVRGSFPNKDKSITPGLFARIRLPVGLPHKALLIPEQALATDQGQKFVYIVAEKSVPNEKGEPVVKKVAVYKKVELGAVHMGRFAGKSRQYREVTEGVKTGDRVIITGLQRVRPDAEIDPKDEPGEVVIGEEQSTAAPAGP